MQKKVKSQKRLRIKDLPHASRPREKLLLTGCENLSEEELVAILLGTGSQKLNAVNLSRLLLKKFPLQKFATISSPELRKVFGIGAAKATRILAAVELGKRLFARESLTTITLNSTNDVLAQAREFVSKKQEYLVVLYINARGELIQREVVGQGSLNQMLITAKEVFSHAVQTPCASIIVVHNHPSGDPMPSEDDIAFTKRIHAAGEVMGIALFDHLIVTPHSYFSFRENKIGEASL